jgi:hypothetical protein
MRERRFFPRDKCDMVCKGINDYSNFMEDALVDLKEILI